jgi:hypothetical protein
LQAGNRYGTAWAFIYITIANGAITSSTNAQGVVGTPFSYQIVADNSPGWYSASGLPPGLGCDRGSGLISGTPTGVGKFGAVLQAGNRFGTAWALTYFTISNGAITNGAPVIHLESDRLTLLTVGSGKVSPNYNNAVLEVGKSYKLTATVGNGSMFSNWVGSVLGNVVFVSSTPRLTFTMRSNLVLQANIIRNPFAPVKGTYSGLFGTGSPEQNSSGFFTLTLTDRGTYSGSLKSGASSYAITGQFDMGGQASQAVARKGTSAWGMAMGLDFAAQQLRGWVSNGVFGGWVADLLANRAVFDAHAHPATPYAGKYTLNIPGATNGDGTVWLGDGYLTISVDAGGNMTYSGSLADGTSVGPVSVPISSEGYVPLYVPLYSGKGSVWSWLEFDSNQPATSLGGLLSWIKPAGAGVYLPAGLTNDVVVEGARYTPPTTGGQVIGLTNGVVIFESGSLRGPLTNVVTLTADNKVIDLSLTNNLSLKVTLASGAFSGSVTEPGAKKPDSFKGVLLHDRNGGYGYFLGTNQSGSVILQGAE